MNSTPSVAAPSSSSPSVPYRACLCHIHEAPGADSSRGVASLPARQLLTVLTLYATEHIVGYHSTNRFEPSTTVFQM